MKNRNSIAKEIARELRSGNKLKKFVPKCDNQVHVWLGKNKICQCGKAKQ